MHNRTQYLSVAATTILSLSCVSVARASEVSTLDDIHYWVGSGNNRAALVIDWDDTSSSDESFVWGYRWDGTSTGEDMLRAVLAEDERLYAKLSPPGGFGIAVYGWGYDLNDDDQLSLTDGTLFDSDGIALSGPPDNPPPAATSVDPADIYAEGWFTGFWNYGNSVGNPFDGGSWNTSGGGASTRILTNEDWDGWTFSTTCTPSCNLLAFPANPQAAVAPLTADFDEDNDVDGADFFAWQRGYGITENAQLQHGDATGDGAVNGIDLQHWFLQFGTSNSPSSILSIAVPEPSSVALAHVVIIFFTQCFTPRRNC